jgi:hypothetical protein
MKAMAGRRARFVLGAGGVALGFLGAGVVDVATARSAASALQSGIGVIAGDP